VKFFLPNLNKEKDKGGGFLSGAMASAMELKEQGNAEMGKKSKREREREIFFFFFCPFCVAVAVWICACQACPVD
jgi:hypothetical protein